MYWKKLLVASVTSIETGMIKLLCMSLINHKLIKVIKFKLWGTMQCVCSAILLTVFCINTILWCRFYIWSYALVIFLWHKTEERLGRSVAFFFGTAKSKPTAKNPRPQTRCGSEGKIICRGMSSSTCLVHIFCKGYFLHLRNKRMCYI